MTVYGRWVTTISRGQRGRLEWPVRAAHVGDCGKPTAAACDRQGV